MFGTIRKHQSWLWFIIIGVMILGMIIWQQGGSGNQQQAAGNFGSIDGKAISTTEMRNVENETMLRYFVQTHQWPDNKQSDLERDAYQRLFLLRRLAQFNIHTDPDTTAKLADMVMRQFNQGQPVPLETFVDQILKPHGLTAEDFQRFLEHDAAIQQFISVIGSSGKVMTPAEIQSLYEQEYRDLSVDAVFFSASNYLAKIPDPTPDALGQFYTNQMAAYREPDKMQLSYVFFNVTNFMPEAEKQLGTNINRLTDEAMMRVGTNTLRFGKTQEEARTKVRELIVEETAISNANTKALAFYSELAKKEPIVQNLDAFAKEKGLEVKVTKPFEKQYGPEDIDLGPNYPVASLFNMSADQDPLLQPIRGTDGVYVLVFNKMIPSRIPPLEEIHARAVSDYKYVQAMRLAQMNGHVFSQTATNELAHGKTFAETCTTTGVKPIDVPPFSLSSQRLPEVEELAELGTFKEVAFATPVGSSSSFIPTREGGFVIHVKKRLPIDETKMKAQLPEFAKTARQRREGELFEVWYNQEAPKALHNIPALQRPANAAR